MKFAFSTRSCPNWDLGTIIGKAKEYGYDGIEIGMPTGNAPTAASAILADPTAARDLLDSAQIPVACLDSSLGMGFSKNDPQIADEVRRCIDAANALHCGLVKVLDAPMTGGRNRVEVANAAAKWIAPLGDYAAERGVALAVENAHAFRRASDMWSFIEAVNHPAVGVCWDVLSAALAGESPALSVPTLNTRIRHIQVGDATLTPAPAAVRKLGEGQVQVQNLLRRLMGIGYQGWVAVRWDKARLATLAGPEEVLPEAIQKLHQWTKSQLATGTMEKKKPTAPAAPVAAS